MGRRILSKRMDVRNVFILSLVMSTSSSNYNQIYHIRRLYFSIACGAFCASLAGIANALVCMPSQVFTTLKFRTGTVDTLRDPRFRRFRAGLLQTTYLLGASIWGTFFMTAVIFVVICVIAFLCGE